MLHEHTLYRMKSVRVYTCIRHSHQSSIECLTTKQIKTNQRRLKSQTI